MARVVHWRAPKGNPHPGLPWCKTSDAESVKTVSDDDIITSDEHRVTCKACVSFLWLGDDLRRAASKVAREERKSIDSALAIEAGKVRANLGNTMEPEQSSPSVNWFGDE
jgi:hypothetical protein